MDTFHAVSNRKAQKDFSLCKRFEEKLKNLENFGATLEEVIYCVFH